jgi:hypothetical protein
LGLFLSQNYKYIFNQSADIYNEGDDGMRHEVIMNSANAIWHCRMDHQTRMKIFALLLSTCAATDITIMGYDDG